MVFDSLRGRGRCRGSVLVLASWLLLLLAFLAIGLSARVMQKAHIFKRLDERDRLRLVAESGISEAVIRIREAERKLFSHKQAAEEIRLNAQEAGKCHIRYIHSKNERAKPHERYAMMDENRKINVNTASPEILTELFFRLGGAGWEDARRLAFAVKDYRDEDDYTSQEMQTGSEKFSYRLSGMARAPKNAPLEFASELLCVQGMTPKIFASVEETVTVYGGGKVNLNTAEPKVLLVFGASERLAGRVERLRRGEDGRRGTADDVEFSSVGDFLKKLRLKYPRMGEEDRAVVHEWIQKGYFGVNGDAFSFSSEATLRGTRSRMRIHCVYVPGEGIRYWAEV